MEKKLVFFDLDHCLFNCNLSELTLKALSSHDLLSEESSIKQVILALVQEFESPVPLREQFTLGYAACRGLKVSEVSRVVEETLIPVLSQYFRPEVKEILDWHQKRGDEIVLLSCSTELVVMKVAKALNISEAYGLLQEYENEVFTGAISGIVDGKEKAKLILHLAEIRGIPLDSVWFYSDAGDDVIGLKLVGNPVAVYPDEELRKIAKENAWPILEYPKDTKRWMLPKVLIVTADTMGGHLAIAKSIQKGLLKYLETYDPVIINIETFSKLARGLVDLYTHIIQSQPNLYSIYHEFLNTIYLNRTNDSEILFRDLFHTIYKRYQPEGVIAAHPLALGFGKFLKQINSKIPVMAYVSDWFGGSLKMWANADTDRIYCPSQQTADYLIAQAGADANKIVVGSVIIPHAPQPHEPLRRLEMKEKLGLNPKFYTLLVNSSGNVNVLPLLKKISLLLIPLDILVLCGTDKQFEKEVLDISKTSNIRVIPIVWTDRITDFYHVSDFVFTRPHPTIVTEALAWKCAILINALQGIMPQERDVIKFLIKNNVGVLITEEDCLKSHLEDLCETTPMITPILKNVAKFEIQNGIDFFIKCFKEII